MHGKIQRWVDVRSFGFITSNEGGTVFVHRSDFVARSAPVVGDGCTFEVETTEKGLRALGVQFDVEVSG